MSVKNNNNDERTTIISYGIELEKKEQQGNIDRSEFAALVEQNAHRVTKNQAYYKQRQQLSDHPRGTIKPQRGFDHVLTRGKAKVMGEVSLVFIGYNLARCAIIVDGLEIFKTLINSHINALNLLFRLQMAYFRVI